MKHWRDILLVGSAVAALIIGITVACNMPSIEEVREQDRKRWAQQKVDQLISVQKSMHRVERDGHLWMVRLSGHAGGLAHHPECSNKLCKNE